jgi:hypothetical protein
MRRHRRASIAPLLIPAIVIGFGISLHAGGVLEGLDITGRVVSPIPGRLVARYVGIRWDLRTIPVAYRINNTQDPIPNPLGRVFLSVADATTALQGLKPRLYVRSHAVGGASIVEDRCRRAMFV